MNCISRAQGGAAHLAPDKPINNIDKRHTLSFDTYVYLVPYVKNNEEIFLKTIIPSRKATNKYVRIKM